MTPPRKRRSFSLLGGAIEASGDAVVAESLARAWRAAETSQRALTHGFHPYPARMPPGMASALIDSFTQARDLVVDPFCGSGTVLVAALASGRRALGVDVNGVAVRLARLKTRRPAVRERRALLDHAERIAHRAAARARRRDAASESPPPPALRGWFDPHVWRELDALGRAIDEVEDVERHGALLLVLSSILTKVSRRRAETALEPVEKTIAPGFSSSAFAARARELVQGFEELERAAPSGTPAPIVLLGSALQLPIESGAARLVLTSPPYLGTYDYGEVQRLRATLLSIPLAAAERHEIGARAPANAAPTASVRRFRDDLVAALREMTRVLAPAGWALVVLGDSSAGERRVRGDELLEESASAAGLALVAAATRGPEHLIALRKG